MNKRVKFDKHKYSGTASTAHILIVQHDGKLFSADKPIRCWVTYQICVMFLWCFSTDTKWYKRYNYFQQNFALGNESNFRSKQVAFKTRFIWKFAMYRNTIRTKQTFLAQMYANANRMVFGGKKPPLKTMKIQNIHSNLGKIHVIEEIKMKIKTNKHK